MAAGACALLIAIGGGAAGFSALTSGKDRSRIVTGIGQAAAAAPVEPGPERPALGAPAAKAEFGADAATSRTSDEADRTAARTPHRKGAPAGAAPAPAKAAAVRAAAPPSAASQTITTRTETETREIPFETRMVRDPSLPRGTQQVETPGVAGEQTLHYLVTLTDGVPTGRRLLDTTVTRPPQHEIVAFGGRYAPAPAPGPDRRRHCGEALNFCVPLGRAAVCPTEADRLGDEESAIQLGGSVNVQDSSLAVLSAGQRSC